MLLTSRLSACTVLGDGEQQPEGAGSAGPFAFCLAPSPAATLRDVNVVSAPARLDPRDTARPPLRWIDVTTTLRDFAIVTYQHELILIELEKPSTRLLKADGNIHSELQHALGQAREWLRHADDHRMAVLQCIGVELVAFDVGEEPTVVTGP